MFLPILNIPGEISRREGFRMEKIEESGSPGWGASLYQTTEDVAKAVAAAAAAVRSPRPSVVYSAKDDTGSPMKKLQNQVSKLIKGLSSPPEAKSRLYNPEILTSQKRQWANFQLQSLDHRVWKEPSRLFESMVVVGLHPSCDIHALQSLYFSRKSEGSGRFRSALSGQHHSRVEPNLEPQVLFVYPPEKQLPLKYKDLLSFCFPAGVEVHAVERTPSMSELNEILLGQEHLKQSDQSFVFRLQVADNSTLYGCCVLVEEIVQKPSGLISMMSEGQPSHNGLSRHILTTRRCYCILSRLPYFELHFGVLNSIFIEERLERLTKQIGDLDINPSTLFDKEDFEEKSSSTSLDDREHNLLDGAPDNSQSSTCESVTVININERSHAENESLEGCNSSSKGTSCDNAAAVDSDIQKHHETKVDIYPSEEASCGDIEKHHSTKEDVSSKEASSGGIEKQHETKGDASSSKEASDSNDVPIDGDIEKHHDSKEDISSKEASSDNAIPIDDDTEKHHDSKGDVIGSERLDSDTCEDDNKHLVERSLPNAVLPLLRYQQYESSDSSYSFQGSPSEDRHFRSDIDEAETEVSFSGQDESSQNSDILEWAKDSNHGSLQIICEYYKLQLPASGSTIKFHPLDHLHPLEYHRPDETVLHVAGSTIDLKSCSTSLELAEVHNALMVEEEANALSVWAIACLCGSLRLEHVLTLFAGALLEKQVVVVCSNLGILSACIMAIIPLIRPYQWQSLLMPVLPNDMLDFLDAPVPYIVGVKNKNSELQSKLTNVVLVDVNKNQMKSHSIPQLPQQKELYASLSSYHGKLVGESFLGKKRPVYECTDVQAEAARGFLRVLRSYLDSLCSNLRCHTITNVQSNNDKVSLLLKDSFIESFPYRDRPFMKLFVDTQLFSVHTDFVLSFFQKE
nr:DENN (AEX-3) domain-containing protein [Ipomoea batatas]